MKKLKKVFVIRHPCGISVDMMDQKVIVAHIERVESELEESKLRRDTLIKQKLELRLHVALMLKTLHQRFSITKAALSEAMEGME